MIKNNKDISYVRTYSDGSGTYTREGTWEKEDPCVSGVRAGRTSFLRDRGRRPHDYQRKSLPCGSVRGSRIRLTDEKADILKS